jgi:mannose-6-phosphate isomerase-like protein (cupin superfamily)
MPSKPERLRKFQHAALPDHSALLSGRLPTHPVSFRSERLQIWYNNTAKNWVQVPETPHRHTGSDEIFIVLNGALIVEAEGRRERIGPREFCCFPQGQLHAIVAVEVPVETLMIRAPSADDKIYEEA